MFPGLCENKKVEGNGSLKEDLEKISEKLIGFVQQGFLK